MVPFCSPTVNKIWAHCFCLVLLVAIKVSVLKLLFQLNVWLCFVILVRQNDRKATVSATDHLKLTLIQRLKNGFCWVTVCKSKIVDSSWILIFQLIFIICWIMEYYARYTPCVCTRYMGHCQLRQQMSLPMRLVNFVWLKLGAGGHISPRGSGYSLSPLPIPISLFLFCHDMPNDRWLALACNQYVGCWNANSFNISWRTDGSHNTIRKLLIKTQAKDS